MDKHRLIDRDRIAENKAACWDRPSNSNNNDSSVFCCSEKHIHKSFVNVNIINLILRYNLWHCSLLNNNSNNSNSNMDTNSVGAAHRTFIETHPSTSIIHGLLCARTFCSSKVPINFRFFIILHSAK